MMMFLNLLYIFETSLKHLFIFSLYVPFEGFLATLQWNMLYPTPGTIERHKVIF